jgi:hypothetical protein
MSRLRDRWLSSAQAAVYLGVTQSAVIKAGHGPRLKSTRRQAGRLRFSLRELQDYRTHRLEHPSTGGELWWTRAGDPLPRAYVRQSTPELALCAAVLEQALDDLRVTSRVDCRYKPNVAAEIFVEVREWFADDAEEPWTCRWLCEQLSLDYPAVRAYVARIDGKR